MQNLCTHNRTSDFITSQTQFLSKCLLRQNSRAVNQNRFLDCVRKVLSRIHLKEHSSAKRMYDDAEFRYLKRLYKLHDEINIIIYTPRLRRLRRFTEARHVKRNNSVISRQHLNNSRVKRNIGSPAVQQKYDFALALVFIYIINRYFINLLNHCSLHIRAVYCNRPPA